MDVLSNLKYAKGSRKNRKRIGRGEGSGHGGTSTKGMNGQLSRSGANHRSWFEGGQMPLQRRVPKFGFTNIFKKEVQIINVSDLQKLVDRLTLPEVINVEVLEQYGLLSSKKLPLKILGNGELKAKLSIEANAVSQSAKVKIEAVGGSIKIV
ncbi:MAG: 50S ribosomal protein L15 [Ignavibacteria bacterium CG_4_8_14_3_um_filter_37_9]|nr:50S ribosomal protein L15 [Ignavibacteria bacterium]OIO24113.1 MAG: 50S ribosomal protein L15 [Ignavibacteria bacterium CG1_02_37_35]PIP79318.1 MAG: 50S ribosomal protein L15 [Ignavibacteria bacterium CG22_combo_CG10-13_8_21_14_all_37_15]PIS44748.1 MAG: 50S ribosomal protein L15 [Ignavibacteria bacterium CG08_land_8_20_14_0_20_37_9]PIW98305.1 MAG: 50S ribosomal protein L15 [Ignavibacteria bacterium CG_4_8_14_3_um_filter_37_9]PIX95464.1 MAG: 50S ribosomal protein L15 [Ignavibacteria bacteriu